MDQEVIYKALRGEATPGELEQVARWHAENPEEFQRCADEVHMQIDMMELYGEEIRPASWIVAHWRSVVRITVQAAAMLAIGLFVGGYISKERTYDMLAGQINTLQVPYGPTPEVHASGRFERSAQFRREDRIPYRVQEKSPQSEAFRRGGVRCRTRRRSSVRRRNFRIRYSGVGYEIQCNRR